MFPILSTTIPLAGCASIVAVENTHSHINTSIMNAKLLFIGSISIRDLGRVVLGTLVGLRGSFFQSPPNIDPLITTNVGERHLRVQLFVHRSTLMSRTALS